VDISIVALIASVFSIGLAIVAIWQANHHRDQSDKLNRDTTEKLARIEAFATSVKEDAFGEIKRYGDFWRAGGKVSEEAEKVTERELRKLKDELQATTSNRLDKVLQTVESKLNFSAGNTFISEIRKEFEELKEKLAEIQEKGLGEIKRLEIEKKFKPLWLSLSREQRDLLVKAAKEQDISHEELKRAGISSPVESIKFLWRLFQGGVVFQIGRGKSNKGLEITTTTEFEEFVKSMSQNEME